ncbi:hypothetical protein NU688_10140 [Variovorax sp. ZS18.2.2]|uniref:hypothetical protein n=1 Tax=Variovorax sp. ZS18.2.2 TaxID=2971255 RepID=UPI00215077A2|nr:hypothetical protein [Variovorax sp. ZS18.2.2]MCR6476515.1 hypothetical protein [Variovorax sp. ZS18.2.2]
MQKNSPTLASKLEIESNLSQVNLERLHSSHANYKDLVDAFARELTSDEVLLISGAAKTGGHYCGQVYS